MNRPTAPTHPLAMDLQFMKGRGYLSASDVGIDDRLTVESLRMEIPDLSFPFDAGGGVGRFRDDRCLVREARLRLDESDIERFLNEASRTLDGFEHPSCTVEDGVVHLTVDVAGHGEGVPITCKAALVTPETGRDDTVYLTLFDYRAYGPLTASVRRLFRMWLTQLLEASAVDLPSSGSPFPLEISGDILTLRPLKWLLLSIFPARGWKVPGTEGIGVRSVAMTGGAVRLTFADEEANEPDASTHWSRRALAAHEAKDTFAQVDEAVFAGDIDRGLRMLEAMEDDYGSHRAWITRRIDLLMAEPDAAAIAEARSLCQTLETQSDRGVSAAARRANLAWITEGPEAAANAYGRLLEELESSDDADPMQRALVHQTLGDLLTDSAPEKAAEHLESALEWAPSRVGPLERLVSLYRQMDRREDLEAALRRLAGVLEDPQRRHDVLVALGRLLVEHSNDEGEGRRWLQKALKHRPDDLGALKALGESYVRSGQPLRAAKTLGQAARSAHKSADGSDSNAADLHRRVARLWLEDLDDADQAYMHMQRAMELGDGGLAFKCLFAEISEARGDEDAALTHWTEVIGECERTRRPSEETQEMRLRAHRHLAELLERLGQHERAERHRAELGDAESAQEEDSDLSAFRNQYETLISEGQKTRRQKKPETPKPTSAEATDDAIDLDRLDRLREADDPAALADALEEAIQAWEHRGDDRVSRERWLRWHRELGELSYLEIEETERARRALEPLREFDPEGLGRDETVLRLLESIYEETGDIDGKTRILRARIEAADSAEMVRTLKVLIAQSLWDERESAEEARAHLRDVLEEAPEHRGAHRLMAKIAESEGRWDDVVEHLETVVEASEGGLDEVELRRRLGEILLEQCDDPKRARGHFQRVVEASPGDDRAIEGLKRCLRELEQWEELLNLIAHQIGVLTGAEDIVTVDRFGEIVPDALDDDTAGEVSRHLTEAAEIAAEHMSDLRSAQSWAGRALAMWDGNIEALELRISIDRILQDHRALARDLVRQANALLDSRRRYDALLEAADICLDALNAPGSARRLLARCLQEDHAEHADPDAVHDLRQRIEARAEDTSSSE